jgi:hypothetical protein
MQYKGMAKFIIHRGLQFPLDNTGGEKQLSLMKLWLPIIISCCLLAGCASKKGCCLPTDDAAQKASPAPQAAGDYAGQWTGSDGATGNLRISLKKPANSPWEGKVSFTYEGDEASTTMKTVEVNGTHVLLTYKYEVQGSEGGVEMTGELAGDSLQGSYKITESDGNGGSWKASRTP